MSKNFDSDYETGSLAEKYIKHVLDETGRYKKVELIKGEVKGKDIVVTRKNGSKQYIESKLPLYSLRSKKVSVEFEYKKKPSGIETTESDWWAFTVYTHNNQWEVVFIKTEELLGMCTVGWPIKEGGDYGASKFYIIPTKEFEELGYFIPGTVKFLPIMDEFQKKLSKLAHEKINSGKS